MTTTPDAPTEAVEESKSVAPTHEDEAVEESESVEMTVEESQANVDAVEAVQDEAVVEHKEEVTAHIVTDEEQVMVDEIESSRSNISASFNRHSSDIIASRSKDLPAATSSSAELQQMLTERVESINAISTLVTNKLEQDSNLIAEFTQQVAALELELTDKENGIVSRDDKIQALSTQITALTNQNTKLSSEIADLMVLKDSNAPLLQRNQKMEETVSSLTDSLKAAKRALEKELKYVIALEKEKEYAAAQKDKIAYAHKYEIDAYKKRVEEAMAGQTSLRKEMDDLRKQLGEEQLNTAKLGALRESLAKAEMCIARLNAEKELLCEELEGRRLAEDEEEGACDSARANEVVGSDPVVLLQKELEVLRNRLGESAEMDNEELMGLQARLDETEKCLNTYISEKNELKAAFGDHQLTSEVEPSHARDDPPGEEQGWITEKTSFERVIRESERAMVLLSEENELLKSKLSVSAAVVNDGNDQDELTALKTAFEEEKRRMMERQQELEGLLIEAMKDKFDGEPEEVVTRLKKAQLEISGRRNVAVE